MICPDTTRRACLLATSVLLVLGGSGCSGSSPGSDGARQVAPSTAEFCGALTDFRADLADADPADPTTYVDSLKQAATRLDAVGAPETMPTEARAGLRTRLAAIDALPPAASTSDLAALGRVEKDAGVVALDSFVAATCPST